MAWCVHVSAEFIQCNQSIVLRLHVVNLNYFSVTSTVLSLRLSSFASTTPRTLLSKDVFTSTNICFAPPAAVVVHIHEVIYRMCTCVHCSDGPIIHSDTIVHCMYSTWAH